MRLNHAATAALIEAMGLNRTHLADAIGFDRANFTHVLKGSRPFPTGKIPALAHAMGVDPFALLGPVDVRTTVIELAKAAGVTAEDLEPSVAS